MATATERGTVVLLNNMLVDEIATVTNNTEQNHVIHRVVIETCAHFRDFLYLHGARWLCFCTCFSSFLLTLLVVV